MKLIKVISFAYTQPYAMSDVAGSMCIIIDLCDMPKCLFYIAEILTMTLKSVANINLNDSDICISVASGLASFNIHILTGIS